MILKKSRHFISLITFFVLQTFGTSVAGNPNSHQDDIATKSIIEQNATIPSLSFKNLMRKFYAGKMFKENIQDIAILYYPYLSKYPYIGVTEIFENDDGKYQVIASMRNPIAYKNSKNETRYLVVVDYSWLTLNGEQAICRLCVPNNYADLFSFEKKPNNQFKLVARTSAPLYFKHSLTNDMDYDDFVKSAKNSKPAGRNLVGFTHNVVTRHGGEIDQSIIVIHIPDSGIIKNFHLQDVYGGYNNVDSSSPLSFDFWSYTEFIKNTSDYHYLEIHTIGEIPIESNYANIKKSNIRQKYIFNPKEGEYTKLKQ